MLANWIKQPTATTGTGTITLGTPGDSFIGMADQFNDGDVVNYFITDGNNREEGKGTYSSGTLTRADVIATLTAGTLAEYPVSGLNLSGNAEVSINPSASIAFNGGIPFLYKATQIDLPDNINNYATSTSTTTANRLYLYPAILLFRRRINLFHITITTSAAGTDTRIGVWDQKMDGNPGNLLFGSDTIDVSTTGTKDITVSPELVLNPGQYWFGFISDSATVQGKGLSSHDAAQVGGAGGVGKFTQARREVGYIVAPAIPLEGDLSITASTDVDDAMGIMFS